MSQYDLLSLAHRKFHCPQIQAFHVLHFAVSEYHEGKVHYQPHVYNTKKTQENLIYQCDYHSRLQSKPVMFSSGGTTRGYCGRLQGLPGFHNNPETR